MPGINRRKKVGIVDVNSFADSPEIYYCQPCKNVGTISKMGGRIFLPDQFGKTTIPRDADDWFQCPLCGDIRHIHELAGTGRLNVSADYELSDQAIDFGKVIIQRAGHDVRKIDKTPDQRLNKKKKSKRLEKEIKDPAILAELREGGVITHYEISRG